MKKNLYFFITILLFVISCKTFAQKNFEPGYVVDHSGDTLHGYIDNRGWIANPDKITFRDTPEGDDETFTPLQTTMFFVQGEIYYGAVVEARTNTDNLQNLTYRSELQTRTDTVFLKTLAMGKADLFFLRDQELINHFYIRINDQGFQELVYYPYLVEHEGEPVLKRNERYKGQLIYYFDDCPGIKEQINKTDYKTKALTKLFNRYNQCTDSFRDISYLASGKKIWYKPSFTTGISITKYNFSGYWRPYLTKTDFDPSVDFSAALGINIIFPALQRKLILYNEVLFTGFDIIGTYDDKISDNHREIHHTRIIADNVKFSTMFRYQLTRKKIKPFFNAGLGVGKLFIKENTVLREKYLYNDYSTNTMEAADIASYELSYLAGAGATYKIFTLELRYEYGDGFLKTISTKGVKNALYLLAGIRF